MLQYLHVNIFDVKFNTARILAHHILGHLQSIIALIAPYRGLLTCYTVQEIYLFIFIATGIYSVIGSTLWKGVEKV